MKQGLSVHCHHDILLEYCTNYDERVDYIKTNKPKHERKIRLEVFSILSKEAIKALPENLVKAYANWDKARADWDKANADLDKAYADWVKARADWDKARADLNKAYADWGNEEREKWHKKFCGCKYWNGNELVFK